MTRQQITKQFLSTIITFACRCASYVQNSLEWFRVVPAAPCFDRNEVLVFQPPRVLQRKGRQSPRQRRRPVPLRPRAHRHSRGGGGRPLIRRPSLVRHRSRGHAVTLPGLSRSCLLVSVGHGASVTLVASDAAAADADDAGDGDDGVRPSSRSRERVLGALGRVLQREGSQTVNCCLVKTGGCMHV